MRVALDATPLLGAITGVGVFCRELLTGLGSSEEVDPVAFALTWRGRKDLAAVIPAGVSTIDRPMAARPLRAAWMKADRPTIERWTGPIDIVHGTNFVVPPAGNAAEVVTVHDLTALHYPELCRPDVRHYPHLISRAIARGAWVHAVSDFVANEVCEHFAVEPSRVVTVYNGVEHPTQADPERGTQLAGGDRYILATGTIEPRKGLPTLVRAFDLVAAEDHSLRLVLAGPDGWGAAELDTALAASAHADRVIRTGWVSDADRRALLAGATLLAYPSQYEGFGLPPLEAMAAATPVVASTAGSLPEVLGDAALFAPPGDVAAWSAAIAEVCADQQLRDRLVTLGAARYQRFSWADTVVRCTDMYRHVLS